MSDAAHDRTTRADNHHDLFVSVLKCIDDHDSFWVSTHMHPDPDAVGSILALGHFLRQREKQFEIVVRDPPPRITRYLPGIDMIHESPKSGMMDVLVVLDVSVLDRISSNLAQRLRPSKKVVNIDHHATGTPFADVEYIRTNACATCEVLFDLFEFAGEPLTLEIAECLYAGIAGDTGNFRFTNTTPRAHEIAGRLIAVGVHPQRAYEQLYGSRTIGQTRLLGMVLDTLETTQGGQIALIKVTQEMYRATGTTTEDVDGFSDYARSVEGVRAVAFLGELPGGRIKVSFRSRDDSVRIDGIAGSFGGGGHAYAAGCILDPPMADAERRIISALRRLLPAVVNDKESDGRRSDSE